jgi:hypothetical protein
MKGRDLKISVGPFSAELAQRLQLVKRDEVCLFYEVLQGRKATLIVANRTDGLRIMVLYDDGGVLNVVP